MNLTDAPKQFKKAERRSLVVLTITGRPQAKGRPRFSSSGHVYTPERSQEAEAFMRAMMRQVCPNPLSGPLQLSVAFEFRRPNSWSKAGRDAVDEGAQPWYLGRGDMDNLVKLVLDAGNGCLWRDDAQVVSLEAVKVYSTEDQTIINVFPASKIEIVDTESLPTPSDIRGILPDFTQGKPSERYLKERWGGESLF